MESAANTNSSENNNHVTTGTIVGAALGAAGLIMLGGIVIVVFCWKIRTRGGGFSVRNSDSATLPEVREVHENASIREGGMWRVQSSLLQIASDAVSALTRCNVVELGQREPPNSPYRGWRG